jgi:hypothetical protein
MTPASLKQAAMKTLNPELWPCWKRHSSCAAMMSSKASGAKNGRKNHPVIKVVGKEIPILEIVVEFELDSF